MVNNLVNKFEQLWVRTEEFPSAPASLPRTHPIFLRTSAKLPANVAACRQTAAFPYEIIDAIDAALCRGTATPVNFN
jgi:hypothetical protein